MEQNGLQPIDLGNMTGRRLSKGQRRIAEYITEHYDTAVFMTASVLGEKVGVSESTVVRFALALGYEGYPALQKALQKMVRSRLTTVQRMEFNNANMDGEEILRSVLKSDMQNIRQTIEDIDGETFNAVLDKFEAARRIYIIGVRSSAVLAQFFGYYLGFIHDNVTVVVSGISDVLEQMSRIGPRDVVVGISFPRYSNRTIEAMRYARSQGAVAVAITDSQMSPLKEVSDLCLTARGDMASFADSLVAPLSLLNALIVGLGQRCRESLSGHLERMEALWAEYKVYSVDRS